MLNTICAAIADRHELSFDYHGHPRIVQPAAAGTHVDTGNPSLRAYQVCGTSNSGAVPDWRMFSLDSILNLTVTGTTFVVNPPGYTKSDAHLNVACEL